MTEQKHIIEDIDDAEVPLWQRVANTNEQPIIVTNESPLPDPCNGATVMVNGAETPLHVVLDELAQLKAGLARMKETEDMLVAAISAHVLESGPVDHELLDIKVRKGAQKTDHERAVMSHMADSDLDWQDVSLVCQRYTKIAWAAVSKDLDVPKATLGRYTSPPLEPTVSIKLRGDRNE